MSTLWLRVRAPFAAFRWMQAGVYRATSPVIPPSAAWGLLLNLAHIDTRLDTGGVTTEIRPDAPPLCIAIGQVSAGEPSVLYQQLHSYPVGSSGKELAPRAHGAKYWIAPVRREVLVGLDCVLGVRCEVAGLLERIAAGVRGGLEDARYGLPFLGDNGYLPDRVDILDGACAARWYAQVAPDDAPPASSCRLTVSIDRTDSSRTRAMLFAPTSELLKTPPERAWTWCPRAP